MKKLRLARVERETATHEQNEVQEEILTARGKPGGRLANLYAMLLNRPPVAKVMGQVGAHVRFKSLLPDLVREATILTVCIKYKFDYETRAHEEIIASLGVGEEDIANIKNRRCDLLPQEVALAINFATALGPQDVLDSKLWDLAVNYFGVEGALDLLVTCSHYTALSVIGNALLPEIDPVGAWKPRST